MAGEKYNETVMGTHRGSKDRTGKSDMLSGCHGAGCVWSKGYILGYLCLLCVARADIGL